MSYSLGIDLGNSNTVSAVVDSMGEFRTLTSTPSVVYFDKNKVIVGEEAKDLLYLGEEAIAYNFKVNVGNPYYKERFFNREYSAESLTTLLLKQVKKEAEIKMKININNAVISIPEYFTSLQREAVITCAKKAGFNKVNIINENTATAMAYSSKIIGEEKKLLIYDIGGGSVSVSLVHIKSKEIEIINTEGNLNLGGKDFSERLALYIVHKFNWDFGLWILNDMYTYRGLLEKAEKWKRELSLRKSIVAFVSYMGKKKSYIITRDDFKRITEDLVNRTLLLSKKLLTSTKYKKEDVDEVLLVGGAARMSSIRDSIKEFFSKDPITTFGIKDCVAFGAAMQGYNRNNSKITHLHLGKKIINRATKSMGIISVNEEGNTFINKIIIEKNIKLPCVTKKTYKISTYENKNNYIELYIVQGENEDPKECTLLGKYSIYGIKNTHSRSSLVDIEYSYSKEEILHISGYQREIGKKLLVRVKKIEEDLNWLKQTMFIS